MVGGALPTASSGPSMSRHQAGWWLGIWYAATVLGRSGISKLATEAGIGWLALGGAGSRCRRARPRRRLVGLVRTAQIRVVGHDDGLVAVALERVVEEVRHEVHIGALSSEITTPAIFAGLVLLVWASSNMVVRSAVGSSAGTNRSSGESFRSASARRRMSDRKCPLMISISGFVAMARRKAFCRSWVRIPGGQRLHVGGEVLDTPEVIRV